MLLRPEDIATLKAQEATFTPKRSLHQLARDALNAISDAGPDSDIDTNLESWFPWRSYRACHDKSQTIVGPGNMCAKSEFIVNTSDANRGGQMRLDFVFYRSDGTFCRLHPGTKKSNDAKPRVFDAPNHPATHGQASLQWALGPEIPYTYEACKRVPQGDRIGKADAFSELQTNDVGVLHNKWWLFVRSLGRLTRDVIGCGVVQAELRDKSPTHVELLFRRADNSEASLHIRECRDGSYKTRLV